MPGPNEPLREFFINYDLTTTCFCSETSYDWIVNMQTWSSAGLAQVVKWVCILYNRQHESSFLYSIHSHLSI